MSKAGIEEFHQLFQSTQIQAGCHPGDEVFPDPACE
jgi:hypothetical protein